MATDSHLTHPEISERSYDEEPGSSTREPDVTYQKPLFLPGRDEASPPQPQTVTANGWKMLTQYRPQAVLAGIAAFLLVNFLFK
jgi:hypothetical protein